MGTLSTHVLDTSRGMPASGVHVQLRSAWSPALLGEGVTDGDGRIGTLGPERLDVGDYTVRFDTGDYFARRGEPAFYPEVAVTFTIADPDEHYHVPLLLNPFGYATYRGS
jgi:5-hydroxyisourate hydrolase